MKTTRLATASLWRKNRRPTIRHWLRASTVNSRSGPRGGSSSARAFSGSIWMVPTALGEPARRIVSRNPGRLEKSVNSDPRIEVGVRDVGHDVENDDERGGHHQIC